jgi:uncharacterized protein (UPF0248 family)
LNILGRKRKGEIHEAVAKFFHRGSKGYIVIAERGPVSGTRRISVDEIERVAADRIILRDGTVIPLHRVIRIEDEKGTTIWARFRKASQDSEEQGT